MSETQQNVDISAAITRWRTADELPRGASGCKIIAADISHATPRAARRHDDLIMRLLRSITADIGHATMPNCDASASKRRWDNVPKSQRKALYFAWAV